jgi:hypothetical protein
MKRERMAAIAVLGFSLQLSPAQTASLATNAVAQPKLAEMERRYLDGKISAREYQRFLQTYRPEPPVSTAVAAATNDVHARALEVLRKTAPNVAANRPGPAITEPLPDPIHAEADTNETARAAALNDVESKLDELIRLKRAREQTTNVTATPTNAPAPAGPKTKRERLDEALKLYIAGKLSDAEYKDRRAKILAEPE